MKLLADILKYAEPPVDRFVECPDCGEKWTNLPTGRCHPCQERITRRDAMVAAYSRETVLSQAGAPSSLRGEFVEPARWARPQGVAKPVSEWRGEPSFVTFAGPTSAGKSMLAAELLYRNGGGRWVVAAAIPEFKFEDYEAWRGLLDYQDFMVVDELGRGHNKDAWEYVYRLLGERWDDLRPTVVTTNLDASALNAAHPALARRIMEGWWVPLGKVWSER